MLQNKKLFIPKQTLAPNRVLKKKHNDAFVQKIFAKYNVSRNNLAAWFDLFYKVDRAFDNYVRTDIEQLLININMQLQILEQSDKSSNNHKSSTSILNKQALTNFKNQLENTVKAVHSSSRHQSIRYLKERLINYNLSNSMVLENAFYLQSIKANHTFQRDLKNEASLNIQAISSGTNLGSIYSFLTREESVLGRILSFPKRESLDLSNVLNLPARLELNLGNILSVPTKAEHRLRSIFSFPIGFNLNNTIKAINEYIRTINGLYLKSIKPYHAYQRDLKNEISLNFIDNTVKLRLGDILSVPARARYGFENIIRFLTREDSGLGNTLSVLTRAEHRLRSNLSTPIGFKINNTIKAINEYIKTINVFYLKSIKLYHADQRDLKNEISLNFIDKAVKLRLGDILSVPSRARYCFENIIRFLTRDESGLGNTLSVPIRAEHRLGNVMSFPARARYRLDNILRFLTRFEISEARKVIKEYRRTINGGFGSVLLPYNFKMVSGGKGINSFYLRYISDSINTIYPIENINGFDRLYSEIGNYEENYTNVINMNPYNFRNYYHIYFPGLSSFISSGFKKAFIQSESIKAFSSIIHDKIVSGLRQELPETLRLAYRLGLFRANKLTKRKQKREMNSETREFWHNMTYNIIQGFRKELENKTTYFFTNYIDKKAYGLSPFLDNEDEDDYNERQNGDWTLKETFTHNKNTSFLHMSERERNRITPYSIYNLRKTYPDIYNMLTFAGLLPTLYVQKHSRETAMSILSKSVQNYYTLNRNLTVKAYDHLRNKLEKEDRGFVWPEAMKYKATMDFRSVNKPQKNSSYIEEIQALKTQVVNIEKQTLQYIHTSNVNVNSLVERIYKEIEQKIKVDRVRRGY
ncbi:hypothetical protein EHE19_014305 [Ruminiclostridium herbifermentans]|uniref:Uncharacterized protein n=1 Tax=Ruminiclostridium herbifermentans TaxID=2488810 RepID=A0A4V6EPV2_9FIRM|nr:hypothetical protein [Ruminiclostridium herbifermentans]QNU66046.1 hypothetical protein EHE19_014305 [Ruminiclostridium herbifermentans]